MIKIKARTYIILLALAQLSTNAHSSDLTLVPHKTISSLFLTGLLAQATKNTGYWPDIITRLMDPPPPDQHSTTFTFNKAEATSGRHDDRDHPDKDDDPEKLITSQLLSLGDMLNQIGEEIERRKIKLILVFDLDGTLYVSPALMPKDLREKLTPAQLFQLHQGWMDELTCFLRRFQANTLLVYNTGRMSICNDDQFEQSQLSNPQSVPLWNQGKYQWH